MSDNHVLLNQPGVFPPKGAGLMNFDHAVLWVDDPLVSLKFYCEVLGLSAVRAVEYEAGDVPFPSVRINDSSILDLMDINMLDSAKGMTGGEAGGHPINHICLNLGEEEYLACCQRLSDQGIKMQAGPARSFGAQGFTAHSLYFNDPDGNIIEIRFYESQLLNQ